MNVLFVRTKLILCFVTTLCLAACATTGDPNSGGIFWSEKKAQERIDSKERQSADAQLSNEQLNESQRALIIKKSRRSSELSALEASIEALQNENMRLAAHIDRLVKSKPALSEEVSRAIAEVGLINAMIREKQASVSHDKTKYKSTLEKQNKSLHQAILLLLE